MPSTPTLYNAWRDAKLIYLSGNFLYGNADVGTTVQLSNDGVPFQTVNVLSNGLWHSDDVRLPDGTYHVTAVSIDAAGNKSAPSPVHTFKVDNTAPVAPTVTLLDQGFRDITPARYTGSAEPGSEVIMDFGQGLKLNAFADADGIWNVSAPLTDGTYQISAVARDAAKNQSAPILMSLNRQSSADAGSNAASAGVLVPGTDTHASIDYGGDVDWFKVNLSSLTTYSFAMKGVRAGGGTLAFDPGIYSDTYLQLWDPRADAGRGAFVNMKNVGVTGGDPVMSANIGVGGDYYLVASAGARIGSYTLSALATSTDDYYDDAAHATPIAIGATINGQFDHGSDVDAFKVDLVAGTSYVFDLGPAAGTADTGTLSINLSDSTRSISVSSSYNMERHAYLSYTAMSSGTYSLSLGNFFSTGSYVFKATTQADDYGASIANHENLAIGSTMNGKLETIGDRDWFGVTLNAGTAYTFILDAPNGYPTLSVFDALGGTHNVTIRDMSNGKVLTWTPTVSGTYFLDVGNSLSSATSYTLLAELSEKDDAGATAANARGLTIGASATGRIELPGDVDWFKISAKANVLYTFDVQALPQGTNSYAYGMSATVVDAAGHSLSTTIPANGNYVTAFQPAVSGDYYLAVAGQYKIFDYVIASSQIDQDIYLASTATAGTIQPGGVVHSTVDFNPDSDWFKADMQAGQKYMFQLSWPDGSTAGTLSSGLTLYDANGAYAATGYRDYNGIYLTYTATKSGSFFISVDGGVAGAYLLKESTDKIPFADTTPPTVFSLRAPAYRSDDPATANLMLDFSEPVVIGTGSITLRLANGDIVETFPAGSARVTIDSSGYKLTIDPSAPLLGNTDYRLDVSAKAITDKVGQPLSSDYSKTFHTAMGALNAVGGSGNDLWANTPGSDIIDGGQGTDTMRYLGRTADYVFIENGSQGWIVSPKAGGTEHDTLTNVERVVFNDGAHAFDIAGTAGQAYRLYQAAFNRVPDAAGLGYWIGQMDKGISLQTVAGSFLTSTEFAALFGAAPNNEAFVTALYGNVLHRAPEQAGHDYWIDALQRGVPRADVLAAFSESGENQAAVIGVIGNGFNYTPYG